MRPELCNGSQYTSYEYTKRLVEAGIAPSRGRTGTALDNAVAESVISTIKTEGVRKRTMWQGAGTAFVFLAIVLLASFAANADYYAVIVGVADYPGTINDLNYTDDDATGLYNNLLEDDLRWAPGRMQLLVDAQASRDAIYDAISVFASDGDADDVFLFYFSGHGTTGEDIAPFDEGDGYDEYLCSYGSTLSEFIRDDELSDWLSLLPMERIVVLLDTCYSGGQIKSVGDDRIVKSIYSGPSPAEDDGFATDLRKISQCEIGPLDLDDLEKLIVVLTSSDEDEYSWEFGEPIAHGLYSYYLLQGLTGSADEEGNLDGDVTAEEAYIYLSPRVVAMSDAYGLNQHPQFLDFDSQPLIVRSWALPQDCSVGTTWLSPAGWHMISIPGEVCGSADACAVLEDDLDPFFLFTYDPTIGGYVMAPPCEAVSIAPGYGYWVRTYEDDVPIDANVEALTQPFTVTVREGWNQLGDPFEIPVCLREVQVVKDGETVSLVEGNQRGWVSKYLFAYSSASGGYQMINPPDGSLEPWFGYWFRAYTDCELVIPPAPCPPPPPSSALSRNSLVGMELPPPPPDGLSFLQDSGEPADGLVVSGNPPAGMRVDFVPNPASDKVTFTVRGICWCHVDGLRMEVYDLSGRRAFTQETEEPRLEWSFALSDGSVIANGVYLVRTWVKVDGRWYSTGIQKLAVCR
jgi:hypothetical protein